MTKIPNCFSLLLWAVFSLWCTGVLYGQTPNRKIIFPTPAGFQESGGMFVRQASDGGYILLGSVSSYGPNFSYMLMPRAIKLDASLEVEWDNTYLAPPPGQNSVIAEIQSAPVELTDGSFVFSIADSTSNFDVVHISGTGELLWGIDLPGFFSQTTPLRALPNGDILATHCRQDNGWACGILHLSPDGNASFWQSVPSLSNIMSAVTFPNGDVLTMHTNNQARSIFTRITPDGQVVWQSQPYDQLTSTMAIMPGGGFGVMRNTAPGIIAVRYFDGQGQPAGESPVITMPLSGIGAMEFYPNGDLFISGRTLAQRGFMARIQTEPTVAIVWSAESPEDGQPHLVSVNGVPTSDGWGIGVGWSTNQAFGLLRVDDNTGIVVNELSGRAGSDGNDDCALQGTEPGLPLQRIRAYDGAQEYFGFTNAYGAYQMYLPAGNFSISVQSNDPFFSLCPDEVWEVSFPAGQNNTATLDLPMQSLELIHHISGHVLLDQNDDCAPGPGDTPLQHWYVQVEFNGNTRIQQTNADGFYQFFLPSGAYAVSVRPYNQLFSACDPAVQNVTFSGDDPQSVTADFSIRADTDCAYMRTQVGMGWVRPCEQAVIPVYYWNEGARDAEDVAVEVTLPASLSYVSASPAPASVSGNLLRFELGQVPASPGGEWRRIDVTVAASCTLQIGDQVCLSAEVTPAEMCGDVPGWNGAVVSLSGACMGDSAVFTIKNIGSAPNSVPRQFRIVEDQIVLLQGTFQLNPLEEQILGVLPALDSSTVVMIAQQEPGFPGDPEVTFTLSGCAGFGSNPSGFGGNPGPFSSVLCMPVRNSYDPNDKQALPLGFGEEHIIRPGTPLDYTIRFQNTGNDTAFAVVLRDTLSPRFDLTRITPIGSSHRFEYALIGDGVLHFHFPGILLPDSATNPEGSQGYVQFRVYPKAGLPLGTVVENRAAIYFDFNPPIITNTVVRKYQGFLVSQNREPGSIARLEVQVFPNPFTERAVFILPATVPEGNYLLELFDAQGRRMYTAAFSGGQCELRGENLPSGVLFWRVSTSGKPVASGKVVGE